MSRLVTRRALVSGLALGGAGLLTGCDRLGENPAFRRVLFGAERVNQGLQRTISNRGALAREFSAADMSPTFRINGNATGSTPEYQAHLVTGFADWQLVIDGLVARPLALSLAQIRQMPMRTQITRHDCVEGWSAIGKWHGVPLKLLLDAAGIRATARYIVFHCADSFGATPYYESINLIDAFHPQTIMAWGMNNRTLSLGHGAPLRLRVERQLGYKHAKFVMRIEAVDSLAPIGRGKGGYWEDVGDYEWYGGI